jgi:hypothetical protein
MKALPESAKNANGSNARKRIHELIEKIAYADPDPAVIEELRRLGTLHPVCFAKEIGHSFATGARIFMSEDMAKERKLKGQCYAKMVMLTRELAGDDPSPARRLCAEAASFAYTEWWLLTMQAARTGIRKEHPLSVKRRNAAHRRYMTSLKVLSQIEAAEVKPRRMQVKVADTEENIFSSLFKQIGR